MVRGSKPNGPYNVGVLADLVLLNSKIPLKEFLIGIWLLNDTQHLNSNSKLIKPFASLRPKKVLIWLEWKNNNETAVLGDFSSNQYDVRVICLRVSIASVEFYFINCLCYDFFCISNQMGPTIISLQSFCINNIVLKQNFL